MGPAGLDVSGRTGEIVDGVRPAAPLPCEPRVDLPVVIAGGAVRPVLVGVNQPGDGVDALVAAGARPGALGAGPVLGRPGQGLAGPGRVPVGASLDSPGSHVGSGFPSLQLLHVSLPLECVGVTLTPVSRIFYRVHRLQPLLLSLGVDHFDDEVYHVYRQGEAHHREEELYPGMGHFNTLVVDLTALHIAGPERVSGVEALRESCVVVRFTAGSVDQPPAETPGPEAEEILAGG